MNSFKFIDKICRICLGDKELFNWNKEIFEFCGTTFRDCYYNYIQLDGNDSDFYPNKLCKMCGNELKNAHFLFERALESFYILQNCINSKNLFSDYSDVEICNEMQTEINQSVEFSDHQDSIDNDTDIYNMSCMNDNIIEDTENDLNNFQQILISNVQKIDPDQFQEIHKFESHNELLLENQKDANEIEKPLSNKNKHKNSCEDGSLTLKVENNQSLPKKELTEKSNETIKNNETTSDQNLNKQCELTTNQPVKNRKKYILICQYCSLEVDGSNQLKKHEATHNKNRQRTHACTKCGLKLYSQSGLNEHMKIHEENRQKKHKCEFCDKAFYNKGALNVHRRIHLGLMHKCQICSKEFFRQIDLDRHLPQHSVTPLRNNLVKKQYVVQCKYCNKTILTKKLKEHMAVHSNQPQMKCKICDKLFYSRTKCVNHLRRLHRKDKAEYDDFIHNFVVSNNRLSLLKIKQEAHVQTIIK